MPALVCRPWPLRVGTPSSADLTNAFMTTPSFSICPTRTVQPPWQIGEIVEEEDEQTDGVG